MAIRYLSGINVDSNTLFVDSANDRVGIGTATPAEKLHVAGLVRIVNSTFAGIEYHNTNGTWETYIGTENGGAGTRYNSASSQHTFYNNGSAVVRINSSGNVGIGTTSPATALVVEGGLASDATVFIKHTNANGYSGIDFYENTGTHVGSLWHANSGGVASNQNAMTLAARNAGDKVYIVAGGYDPSTSGGITVSAGNVGIGTTSPSYTLDVAGQSRFGSGAKAIVGTDGTYGGYSTIGFGGTTNGYNRVFGYDGTGDGLYLTAATGQGISLWTNGTNSSMFIASAGNVGIGTNSPSAPLTFANVAGNKIDLYYTTSSGGDRYGIQVQDSELRIHSGALGDAGGGITFGKSGTTTFTEAMRITNAGNVGIGNTTPGAVLTVGTQSSGTAGSGVAQDNSIVGRFGAANTAGRVTALTIANTATPTVGNDATLSFIVGGNYSATGLISSILQNTSTARTDMAFSVYNVDGNYERMRITGGGNVGIGTTAPGAKLHVVGGLARVEGVETDQYFFEGIRTGTSTTLRIYDNSSNLYYDSYGTMIFRANQNGGSGGYIGFFGGNVGIGTTSPYSKLEVTSTGPAWGEGITINPPASGYEAVFFRLEGTSGSTYTGTWAIGKNASSEAGGELFQVVKNGLTGSTAYRVDASQQWKTNGDSIFGYSVGIGNLAPTQKLHVTGNIRVTGAYYDSNNEAGTSGQVLSSTGSGTDWVTPYTSVATSLYDLLPAARVAYNWTGQVVNDTWVDIFSAANNILTTGTWMVQMYISDWAQGGQHYTYTYTGTMQWYQETVNQGGEPAASEIYLHRMGHAANASALYLRTTEMTAVSGGIGKLQVKANYSNTSNTTINFKFVKIF